MRVPANLLVIAESPSEIRVRWGGGNFWLRFDARQQRWLLSHRRGEVMTYPEMPWIAALELALGWIREHAT